MDTDRVRKVRVEGRGGRDGVMGKGVEGWETWGGGGRV